MNKEIKEQRFIQAKVQGKNNQEAGLIAGAKSKYAASKYAQRLSKNVSVQQRLAKALRKQGITIETAIAPIAPALQADKTVIIGKGEDAFADIIPDHTTRLNASKLALDLLGAKNSQPQVVQTSTINNKEITEAIQKGDEIELYRLVFGKKSEDMETKVITPSTPIKE